MFTSVAAPIVTKNISRFSPEAFNKIVREYCKPPPPERAVKIENTAQPSEGIEKHETTKYNMPQSKENNETNITHNTKINKDNIDITQHKPTMEQDTNSFNGQDGNNENNKITTSSQTGKVPKTDLQANSNKGKTLENNRVEHQGQGHSRGGRREGRGRGPRLTNTEQYNSNKDKTTEPDKTKPMMTN